MEPTVQEEAQDQQPNSVNVSPVADQEGLRRGAEVPLSMVNPLVTKKE